MTRRLIAVFSLLTFSLFFTSCSWLRRPTATGDSGTVNSQNGLISGTTGAFSNTNGPALTLDTTFGSGGLVVTAATKRWDVVKAIGVQPNGMYVAVGHSHNDLGPPINNHMGLDYTLSMVRYDAQGNVDRTFGSETGAIGSGVVLYPWSRDIEVAGAVVQADGSIVIAATVDSGTDIYGLNFPSNKDFAVFYFDVNGVWQHTNFGPNFPSAQNDIATSLAVSSAGLVVAGYSYDTNGVAHFVAARYLLPSLAVDTTFGSGGSTTVSFGLAASGETNEAANAVLIQADGKIVLAGHAYDLTHSQFALARLNTDGSVDTSFGSGGTVITDFGLSLDSSISAISLNGTQILAGGYARNNGVASFAMVQYNPDGSLDTGFGNGDGKVTTTFTVDSYITSLTVAGTEISAVGYALDGNSYDFAIARYAATGGLDAGFGSTTGMMKINYGNFQNAYGWAVAPLANGGLILGGAVYSGTTQFDYALAKLIPPTTN